MMVQQFKKELDKLRKVVEYNPYEGSGRTTHCYITTIVNDKEHKFEVRGWNLKNKPRRLEISAVNWTITAGTCLVVLDKVNVNNWKIEEN